MRGIRSLAIVGACLVLSMAGWACGADRSPDDDVVATGTATDSTATAATKPSNIVTNADIRRTQPGTPARALVTWAQAVQFGDVASVREAYTARVRAAISRPRMDSAVRTVGQVLGRPEIVTPIIRGDVARVRTQLVSYDAESRRSLQPATFSLRREQGQWLLDDARLLLDSAAAMRRAAG